MHKQPAPKQLLVGTNNSSVRIELTIRNAANNHLATAPSMPTLTFKILTNNIISDRFQRW